MGRKPSQASYLKNLKSSEPEDSAMVVIRGEIKCTDVLLGKSRSCQAHIGNTAYRGLIDSRVQAYQYADSKSSKIHIVVGVTKSIYEAGGRFLISQHGTDDAMWNEVAKDYAREKVGNSLRDAVKLRKQGRQRAFSVTSGVAFSNEITFAEMVKHVCEELKFDGKNKARRSVLLNKKKVKGELLKAETQKKEARLHQTPMPLASAARLHLRSDILAPPPSQLHSLTSVLVARENALLRRSGLLRQSARQDPLPQLLPPLALPGRLLPIDHQLHIDIMRMEQERHRFISGGPRFAPPVTRYSPVTNRLLLRRPLVTMPKIISSERSYILNALHQAQHLADIETYERNGRLLDDLHSLHAAPGALSPDWKDGALEANVDMQPDPDSVIIM